MRYHKEFGFPPALRIPEGIVRLWYSVHAKERFEGKYRGFLILPSYIKLTKDNIFEVETDDNETCNKVAARITYDNKKDICIVLNPINGKVVTLWINHK